MTKQFYCLFQKSGSKEWHPHFAEDKHEIDGIAEFVTALDIDTSERLTSLIDKLNASYMGDLYFDLDGPDREDVILQLHALLNKLEGMGVQPDAMHISCSGNKGFHVTVPRACYMKKEAPGGIKALYAIYGEMAEALKLDGLDMSVYSYRRQWRCPGVARRLESGRTVYKVQISHAEAMAMTPELYETMVSTPRPPLRTGEGKFAMNLGVLFSQTKQNIEKKAKSIAARKAKKTGSLLSSFNGQWPEPVKALLDGAAKPGVGWNKIAMQLAICAHELEIDADKLIADAQVLIRTHKSDSQRYNSVGKRERELKNQWEYMADAMYEVAPGPLVAIIASHIDVSDLSRGEMSAADVDAVLAEIGGETNEDGEVVDTNSDFANFTSELRIGKTGIFYKEKDSFRRASLAGWANPIKLVAKDANEISAYEVDLFIEGKSNGKMMISTMALNSRASMQALFSARGTSINLPDMQINKLNDVLRKATESDDRTMLRLTREGMDIVETTAMRDQGIHDIVWVAGDVIISKRGLKYRFDGEASEGSKTRTDLHLATPWTGTEAEARLVHCMLEMNRPDIVAKVVGFFMSSFLSPMIRHCKNQYPMLQVYGQAGSGKSKTVEVMASLCYHVETAPIVSTGLTTPWGMIANVTQSSSIPVIFEEVKPREMAKDKLNVLHDIMKGNYTGINIERGSIYGSRGQQRQNTISFVNKAPIVFVGEAIDDEAAILDRCVVAPMSISTREGREANFNHLLSNRKRLGGLGRCLLESAMALDMDIMQQEMDAIYFALFNSISEEIKKKDRQVFNYTVCIIGLRFLKRNLEMLFGRRFDEKIDELEYMIAGNVSDSIEANASEASRVLNTLSYLSSYNHPELRMVRGIDYTVSLEDGTMDIKMRNAYSKYVRYQRTLGETPLFDSESKFLKAMQNYGGTKSRSCPDNPQLYRTSGDVIYRFKLTYMVDEQVQPFN